MKKLEYIINETNRLSLVDDIAAAVEDFCTEYIRDKREITRYRLTIEECILKWLETDCIGKTLSVTMGKRPLCNPSINIAYNGDAMNPYVSDQQDEYGLFGYSVLSTIGLSPSYGYRMKTNNLKFEIKCSELNPIIKIIGMIALAVIVGFVGKLILPTKALELVLGGLIEPVYDTFFHILSCIAGPMIFLSVAWGVYGIGDASTLNKIGKKMMLSYVGAVFLVVLCGASLFPIMGLKFQESADSTSQLASIMRMILDIFPSNIVDPFSTGNTLQIILLGFVVGVALLFLGQRTESVARAIEQINYLVQFLMGLVGKLVPYFVFIVIVSLIWSDTFSSAKSTMKLLIIIVITFAITNVIYYAQAAFRNKIGLLTLMKKCLPNLLIALSTASSSATFSSSMDICEKELGISNSISGFGVPLAMVMHKPTCALNFLLVSFFFADFYDVECSVTWLITAVITCTILAVATPPIPGGGAASYTVLFLQLGIPEGALAIALSLDMITDFLMTASDMYCLPVVLLNVSNKLGLIDREVLQKK